MVAVDLGVPKQFQEGPHHRVLVLVLQDLFADYVFQLLHYLVLLAELRFETVAEIVESVVQAGELSSVHYNF